MPAAVSRRSRSESTVRGAPVAASSSLNRRSPSDTSRTTSSAQRSPTRESTCATPSATVLSLDPAPRPKATSHSLSSVDGRAPALPGQDVLAQLVAEQVGHVGQPGGLQHELDVVLGHAALPLVVDPAAERLAPVRLRLLPPRGPVLPHPV